MSLVPSEDRKLIYRTTATGPKCFSRVKNRGGPPRFTQLISIAGFLRSYSGRTNYAKTASKAVSPPVRHTLAFLLQMYFCINVALLCHHKSVRVATTFYCRRNRLSRVFPHYFIFIFQIYMENDSQNRFFLRISFDAG